MCSEICQLFSNTINNQLPGGETCFGSFFFLSDNQEILQFLWYPKNYYCVHQIPLLHFKV